VGEEGCPRRLCPSKRLEVRVVYGELKGHFGRERDPTLYLVAMLEGTPTWLAEPVVVGGKLSREGLPGQWQTGVGEVEDGSRDGDCEHLLES